MGQAGSDVAKDASDIVLTDDNFASILNAIEEGRRMFDNIQKFILHLLAENVAQAVVLLVGLAFKDSRSLSVYPLAPVQIMWVIMITSMAISVFNNTLNTLTIFKNTLNTLTVFSKTLNTLEPLLSRAMTNVLNQIIRWNAGYGPGLRKSMCRHHGKAAPGSEDWCLHP